MVAQSVVGLLRLWLVVYIANIIGTAVFAWMLVLAGPASGTITLEVIGEIAHAHSDPPATTIFLAAVFAGWLMGLLSWLVTAARDTISQIVIVWLITTAIGFGKFQHVIVGSVQMFAALFAGQSTLPAVGHFLLWATLGNIVGGSIFVALIKYSHAGWADDRIRWH